MSDTPKTDAKEKAYWSNPTSHVDDVWTWAQELERENAALREQLQWTTRRIEILSTTFYGIEDLFKNALTEMLEDSLQVKEKKPQP